MNGCPEIPPNSASCLASVRLISSSLTHGFGEPEGKPHPRHAVMGITQGNTGTMASTTLRLC